jgi:hypothetical protein
LNPTALSGPLGKPPAATRVLRGGPRRPAPPGRGTARKARDLAPRQAATLRLGVRRRKDEQEVGGDHERGADEVEASPELSQAVGGRRNDALRAPPELAALDSATTIELTTIVANSAMAAITSPLAESSAQSSIASTDSETESFDLVGLLVDPSEDEEDDQDPSARIQAVFRCNGEAAHDASALPASAN